MRRLVLKRENNKKYFICGDIHSFYTEFREGLAQAGFDVDNKNHILIILGDLFDRGYETEDMFDFVTKFIDKSRLILVRGNHEDLLVECIERKGLPKNYDYSNGTMRTIQQIACDEPKYLDRDWISTNYILEHEDEDIDKIIKHIDSIMAQRWQEVKEKFKQSELYKFVKNQDNWYDYVELDDYILVHSFIPLKQLDNDSNPYHIQDRLFEYKSDWRETATKNEMYTSRCGCPWLLYKNNLFKESTKTLVCGHWHTTDFYKNLESTKPYQDYGIFYGKNIIALDGCTVLSHKVNVLVL